MYTESRNNFSLRNVILQFLFLALLVFILLWIFPTKKDMKKATKTTKDGQTVVTTNNTDLSILYDRIFNENIMSMKEAAQSYYTTERLPQKVGDTTKMTLREMLAKKIVLPFKDKHGKQCDLDASYVQITKKENEFVMKVNLKCGSEENYLLTYMGCYDYCSQTICEKKGYTGKVYKVVTPTTTPKKYYCKYVNGKYYDKNGVVVSKSAYEKSCITKTYYCKIVNGKYYDNNGKVVSKAEYEKACIKPVTYYCKIVNGKYYDNTGKVVSKAAYEKACTTPVVIRHYCEVVNGKYYDNKGNVVSKEAYEKACTTPVVKYYCQVVNGKYYDKNGKVVSKQAYEDSCFEKHYYCQVVNGKYYDKNGKVVSKQAYEDSCFEKHYYCTVVNGKYYDINGKTVSKEAYEKSCFKYTYEYVKVTQGSEKWSEWSEWSEKETKASSTVEVQKKTTKYKKLTGYNVKTENDTTKPINEIRQVVVGSSTVKSCASYNLTSTVTGYTQQYIGQFKYTVAPKETETYTYRRVGGYNWYCESNCTAGTVLVYDKYQKIPQTSSSYSCAKYVTEKTVYVTNRTVLVGYEKKTTKTPVYEYYDKITYRFRTKTVTQGTKTIKWSSYNNKTLLNAGYSYTGNYKVERITK